MQEYSDFEGETGYWATEEESGEYGFICDSDVVWKDNSYEVTAFWAIDPEGVLPCAVLEDL